MFGHQDSRHLNRGSHRYAAHPPIGGDVGGFSGLDPWGVQGSAVAHQQLTGSAVTRLDRQGLVGIKNLVQGKKNRPISRAVTQAVAIPITRLPAPDLDLMGKSYR